MNILVVVVGTLVALVAIIARTLAVDEVRGYIRRRITASVDATIASLPPDLQKEWADEWRAELEDVISTPVTAALFARGLRRSAIELSRGQTVDEPQRPGEPTESRDLRSKPTTDLDLSDRRRRAAMQEAAQNMARAYEILRTRVGAPHLIDNASLREVMVCAKIGLIWRGGHSDIDAIDPKTGEAVEIKSTRLVDGGAIHFSTVRSMSSRTIARLLAPDYWLFSVFDDFSNLVAVYRCNRADMSVTIHALESAMNARDIAAGPPLNNPKIRLDSIRARCTVAFQNKDFEEYELAPGRWCIRQRDLGDTSSAGRWSIVRWLLRRVSARPRIRPRS